ncbi:hypothetical protein KKF17_03500 [Patescibacteria group bacterium]|nr:hypothetical protein [Patescibacteria group bacterium]
MHKTGGASIIEFNSYRKLVIDSLIMSQNVGLNFFESATLAEDELPIIVNNNNARKPIVYHSASEGGGTYLSPQIEYGKEEEVRTYFITSDEKWYNVDNAIQGRTPTEIIDNINRDVADSLDIKLDEIAWTLAKTALGIFTEGTDYYVYDKRVKNFPTTNILNLTGLSDTGLSPAVFKAIGGYILRLGKIGGIPVRLKNIYVAPEAMMDCWDWVDIVAGFSGGTVVDPKKTVPSDVRNAIWRTGIMPDLLGQNANLIPLNTMEPGEVFFDTTIPIGYFWTKPSLDKDMIKDNTYEDNRIYYKVRKCVGHAVLSTKKIGFGQVKYNV